MPTANELSELQAVDFGLGHTIVTAFDGLAAVGPVNYKKFIARDSNKQIIRHDFDAPQDFISSYIGDRKGSKTVDSNTTTNVLDLPVIAYCRKPGISTEEGRGGIIHEKIRWDEALEKAFKLSVFPLTLQYSLMMLAWDKPTLDKLQLAWHAFLSNRKAKNHVFEVTYLIDKQPLNVNAFIQDPTVIETTDISLPKGEGRVFAVEQTLTVTSQVLFGEAVEIGDVEVHFNLVGYCGLEVPCCGE